MDWNRSVRRRSLVLLVALLCTAAGAGLPLHAQGGGFQIPALPEGTRGPAKMMERYPEKPSIPAASSIPLPPLGFSIPGDNYLLRQQSLVSVDFLDEETLLFTFHVASGLMQRNARSEEGAQQRIRAVVLDIRNGRITAQQEWSVPDRLRYLWMLNGGHFLLRVRDGIDEADSQLHTKPWLRLPGRLMWIQMDPEQQFLIANSLESDDGSSSSKANGVVAPKESTASGNAPSVGTSEVLVARTIRLATRNVSRVTQVPWTSQKNDWPMNSEGYLERVHENGANWTLRFRDYSGKGDRIMARVESTCRPRYGFASEAVVMVSTCDPQEGWKMTAMSSQGKSLWQTRLGNNEMSSQMVTARNGSRVISEILLLRRFQERYKRMIGAEDLLGQMVRVFDTNSGKVLMTAPLSPIFDGGGNVAISPLGKRVAILDEGAIQIFDLPPERGAQANHR